MITDLGKTSILRVLAGQIGKYAQALAVGSGANTPVGTDTTLQFEFDRTPITLTNVDFTAQTVTFKGTLSQTSIGKIYEVGIWSDDSQPGDFASKLLASFEPETESWDVGTFETTNARLGSNALKVSATASTTTATKLSALVLDLSGYSSTDSFVLAVYGRDSNTSNISIRFKTDSTNYYQLSTTIVAGYNVKTMTKASATITGSPSWSDITEIELRVTASGGGTTNVDFDGLRIEDYTTDTLAPVLISRSVLVSPITKTNTSPLDIEYTLDFDIT